MEVMRVKSVEVQTSSCSGVVGARRNMVQAQVSSSSLDHGSKGRGQSPKAFVQLYRATVVGYLKGRGIPLVATVHKAVLPNEESARSWGHLISSNFVGW
ncbi:hypothetical protein TNCV_3251751 [Trichonephila clavipes]|nr:hypothetical protein TNCV_3251751 [Trichonephila clavipes]